MTSPEQYSDDRLIEETERAHGLWLSTPRWRWLRRLRRENAWLELCRVLQERESRKARERLGNWRIES